MTKSFIKLSAAMPAFRKLSVAMLLSLVSFAAQAQTIGGAVFGGGRMGDVTGSTLVTVVTADTISAVYGGNDIAGTVSASTANDSSFQGAQVVIGNSSSANAINIGSVYGGGNGYYYYPVMGTTVTTSALTAGTVHNYDYDASNPSDPGNVDVDEVTAGLLVPQVTKTRVSMHTQYSFVDSIFGGAKNAFVTQTGTNASVNSTSVNLYGGTAYSVFGGNNYGGTLGAGSAHAINVYATTTGTSANLGGDEHGHAVGGHGVRYLFGGGNKVPGQFVRINVYGGQIDTLFAGGNSADVATGTVSVPGTQVNVNVTSPLYTVAESPYVDATSVTPYSPTTSVFDIRCLFGGNNAADMSGVPELTLTKGGIHNVYGGGNVGEMNGSMTYTDNESNASATLSTKVILNSANIIVDTLYGGGQSAGTLHDTYVEIANGYVGTVFGGTNISGTIPSTAKSNVRVSGASAIVENSVFGGSNGYYRCMNDEMYDDDAAAYSIDPATNPHQEVANLPVPSIYHTNVLVSNGLVREHVYAGGNLAFVAKPGAGNNGTSKVTITGGTIGDTRANKECTATVFGGGNFANVYGTADVHITGGTINGDVYGGNDKTGTVTGLGRTGYSTVAEADVDNMSTFVNGATVSSSKITLTQANAATYVLVEGTPTITGSVYGGGNGAYNYSFWNGSAVETLDLGYSETVFRCSRPTSIPTQFSGFVDIHVTTDTTTPVAGTIGNVFAGGNGATVGVASVTSGDGNTTLASGNGQAFVYINCTGDGPAATANSTTSVGSVFGGNNRVDMGKVPHMWLVRGKVGSVYGGGNLGGMTGNVDIEGSSVSTYVAMGSEEMMVAENLFGGCNAADVTNDSYVHVRKGTVLGNIFGGNDRSGEVNVARVFVDGDGLTTGNIYGGSNGDYAFYRWNGTAGNYTFQADANSDVDNAPASVTNPYFIGHKVSDATHNKTLQNRLMAYEYIDLKGRPFVDSAAVVINGDVTVRGDIYGGGISGDCRKTDVLINSADAVLGGMVFGAGRGRIENTGIRINGSPVPGNPITGGCKDYYIGVAQFDGNGDIVYGEGSAMGNVLDSAVLTVVQFKSMNGDRSAMFGGGRAGDVGTSVVRYQNTATAKLDALYLGCLASDVEHAVGEINATDSPVSTCAIDTIYGGNDFTGRVGETDLVVNSGIINYLFGGGNGDYYYYDTIQARTAMVGYLDEDDAQNLARTNCNCYDTVPYTMKVTVTVNGGTFLNTVYGGGNMGLVGNRDLNPAAVAADDYGLITFNVHGGTFRRHIFTGARGKTNMETRRFFGADRWTNDVISEVGKNVDGGELGKQLVYGFKVFNMDGGEVEMSVYGGSESVDDGYPFECKGHTYNTVDWFDHRKLGDNVFAQNTTMRPTSVLNFVGGTVEKSIYGGGYQGNIYGSVYVNIGYHAIYDSPVWTATANYDMSAYKPNITGLTRPSEINPDNVYLTVDQSRPLYLRTSVYNGSDWGEALDNPYFNTRGVFGGKTNILIDGKGYNISQTNTQLNSLPSLNIRYSIIGAGTSTEGGDVNRLITIRHYGDWADCHTSRTISSIQRADKLVLDSVFLSLEGEQDAFSAYASPSYSLCRLDTIAYVVDNVIMLQAPAIYIGNVYSLKADVPVTQYSANLYTNTGSNEGAGYSSTDNRVATNLLDNLDGNDCSTLPNACEDVNFCLSKVPFDRGTAGKPGAFNTLVLENGSYMRIMRFVDKDSAGNTTTRIYGDGVDDGEGFGIVNGWMYLVNKDKTMAYVYARPKTGSSPWNNNDGGFVAPCKCDNEGTYNGTSTPRTTEMDYLNVTSISPSYRTWKVGKHLGTRKRHITLIANADPTKYIPLEGTNIKSIETPNNFLQNQAGTADSLRTLTSADKLAYSTAVLELPPSEEGHFFVINEVQVDQENGGDMKLVQQGYSRGTNDASSYIVQADAAHLGADMTDIKNDTTGLIFGLTFTTNNSGSNFTNTSVGSTCWTDNLTSTMDIPGHPIDQSDACWPYSLVLGNRWFSQADGYISPAVVTGSGIIPTMSFTLTYNHDFHNTITRDILFVMNEYDADGNFVGPVEVTITISSVIKEFGNLEAPLLAMYNEGISNEYIRKITIPAGFLQRDIYIDGIEWNLNDWPSSQDDDWFHMQDDSSIPDNNNHFAVIVTPSENTSDNITNHLGWYHIQNENIDLYSTALSDFIASRAGEEPSVAATSFLTTPDQTINYSTFDYLGTSDGNDSLKTNLGKSDGLLVGTLDGRAPAAMDVKLIFNGDYVYHNRFSDRLASLRLRMHWRNTKTDGEDYFYIDIPLRTREHGDTIYWAPNASLTRQADNGTSFTLHSFRSQSRWADDHWESNADAVISPLSHGSIIYGDPRNYLQTLQDVTDMYQEGDVIDILETIPIGAADGYVNITGDDFSTIQIIRYSGSHFSFPSLGCAHRGPLFDVTGGVAMRNVLINGSYCTRVKESTTTNPEVTHSDPSYNHYTQDGSLYYDSAAYRVEALLESHAPVFYIHGDGHVNFSYNVNILNNMNNTKMRTDRDGNNVIVYGDPDPAVLDTIPGGAIALVQDNADYVPELILGGNIVFRENVVVDWNAAGTPVLGGQPLNYGAGVYVDGGEMNLGTSSSSANNLNRINISHNFYLKSNGPSAAGIKPRLKYELGGNPTPFNVYVLDTVNHADVFSLSNVYLARTPGSCPDGVRRDVKSNVMYLASLLDPNSRIGVSKWFPGYKYSGATPTNLVNAIPRDTVGIVFQSYGTTDLVKDATQNNIFFNDSSYFSIAERTPHINVDDPGYATAGESFVTRHDSVTYDGSISGYGDRVFVFFHEYVHSNRIYLQRCASFGKGVVLDDYVNCGGTLFNVYASSNNDLAFHWNKDATCVASTDSVMFHVGGGFFPYTYTWYKDEITTPGSYDGGPYRAATLKDHYTPAELDPVQMRQRQTYGDNSISSSTSAYDSRLRSQAMVDTLILTSVHNPQNLMKSTYLYRVQANDITGNCMVEQPFMVRVGKVSDTNYLIDDSNFLCHKDPALAYPTLACGISNASYNATYAADSNYRVYSPGVDSNSFHDNVDHIAQTWADTANDNTITQVALHHATTPYFDSVANLYSGLLGTVYEDPMVPRYMRAFHAYKIHVDMFPEAAKYAADDFMKVFDASNSVELDIDNIEFCPGGIINLRPHAKSGYEYMAWNFDPSSADTTTYIVAEGDNNLEVYYAPNTYWYQTVTSRPAGYTRAYNGDVTITSRDGLAWLISTVNGYNGQNAHSFQNNVITLNLSEEADLAAHKWTPLGNANNPFRGTIVVAESPTMDTQIIKNIIVNEPILPRVGMFGYTEGADISGFRLTNVAIKGTSYVAGVVAESHNSTLSDIAIDGGNLFSEYVVGGIAAKADNTKIDGISKWKHPLNATGNAIQAGAFIGAGSADTLGNSHMDVDYSRLSAVYLGAFAGQVLSPGKKSDVRSVFNNNYAHIITGKKSQRVGGMIGRADNVDMNNNYVHGKINSTEYAGALVGYLGQKVSVRNCYYSADIRKSTVGYTINGSAVQNTSSFTGSANEVHLTNHVGGYSNLTRALNAWVKANQVADNYRTWRSDMGRNNYGYPLFGTPDMIRVQDSVDTAACYSLDWDGITYYEPGRYIFHVVDSADYLDSTFTLMLSISYGDSTYVADTINIGEGYEGYGFDLSSDDISRAYGMVRQGDVTMLQFVDSLYNGIGCDSLVFLTLYVMKGADMPDVQQLTEVKVYPNPTRGIVNVEGSDLQSIEVYDNISRQVLKRSVDGDKTTFDLSGQPTGNYYIRVRTAHGTVVKKLVKK